MNNTPVNTEAAFTLLLKISTGLITFLYFFLPVYRFKTGAYEVNPCHTHNVFCWPREFFEILEFISGRSLACLLLFISWLLAWIFVYFFFSYVKALFS